MQQVKIGIAGAGVFGTYHAQKAAASPYAELIGVYDVDVRRAELTAQQFGRTGYSSYEDLLNDVDAVVVAVPASYHEPLVRKALQAGRHVLVEKPLTLDGASARDLSDLALSTGRVLQVGHQERWVARAMGVLDIAAQERPVRMESVRAGPPAPNGRAGDVSVIWDLMIHDLDLAACLFGREFGKVIATGEITRTRFIDTAHAEIAFADGGTVFFMASRDAEERKRTMKLVFNSGEIDVDFLTRRVRNTTPYPVKVDISDELPDPLGAADKGFYLACLGREESFVPGQGAVAAVRMAEAVEAAAMARLTVERGV